LNQGKIELPLSLPNQVLIKFLTYLQIFIECHDDK
jgi:hypothetical protein